jgi:hypothetical protein
MAQVLLPPRPLLQHYSWGWVQVGTGGVQQFKIVLRVHMGHSRRLQRPEILARGGLCPCHWLCTGHPQV